MQKAILKGIMPHFNAEICIAVFFSIGLPCPTNFNPADHYINRLSLIPKEEQLHEKKINFICNQYQTSSYCKAVSLYVDEHIANGPTTTISHVKQLNPYKASWFQQFWALLGRSYRSMTKDPVSTSIRIFQYVFVGLIIGILFFDQDIDQVTIINCSFQAYSSTLGWSE